MSLALPSRPSLEWLRKTAKRALTELRKTNPQVQLADAQLAVAREHGFSSWRKLKGHVEAVAEEAPTEALAEKDVAAFFQAAGTGQIDTVRRLLNATPHIVNAIGPHPFWGGRPQALHVAIEAKRHDVFALLLDAGADASGSNVEYDHWSPLMLAIDRGPTRPTGDRSSPWRARLSPSIACSRSVLQPTSRIVGDQHPSTR